MQHEPPPKPDLLHELAELLRLETKARAERAVAYVLENPSVTYDEAATLYSVGIQQVRGRVISRWGSLAAARTMTQAQRMDRPRVNQALWTRPCLKCRCTKARPRGQYVCDPCTAAGDAVHEGGV